MPKPPARPHSHRHSLAAAFAALALALASAPTAFAADTTTPSGPAILQDLKSFQQMATVLMIAAHPDDENTQLIAYLARGRNYRMGYLSITRGNGGQNLLGGEFGDDLGLIRTHELLAARALDGGRQFFTRAIDFGYSKNPEETLRIWDRDKVLSDVVRVIRIFRPDVLVTRFAPTQTNTHGHHTASAILGLDAFKIVGDPKAYPEQIAQGLAPWQPKRILLNGGGGGPRGGGGNAGIRVDVSGTDPVLNLTYADLANRSRAMHKSQGFGQPGTPGGRGPLANAVGPRYESFQLLGGEEATQDIMDGIDTTWLRVPNGGAEIATLVQQAVGTFNPDAPDASVPALLEIKKRLAALPADPIVDEKHVALDRIIANCLRLTVTTMSDAEVVPGDAFKMAHSATVGSTIPVRWLGVRYRATKTEMTDVIDLKPTVAATRASTQTLPAATPVSQPYWMREEPDPGIYHVADPALIGRPVNPPAFPIEQRFEIGGQTLVLSDQPMVLTDYSDQGRKRADPWPMEVIAPVSMAFHSEVRLFAPGKANTVDVDVTAHRADSNGSLTLKVPANWSVSPPTQPFKLNTPNGKATLTFTVTPPGSPQPLPATLAAVATVNGHEYTTSRKVIDYAHIPYLLLQPPATLKALVADVDTRGKTIGYLPGAGDGVAECIEQLGYTVRELKGADLTPDNLKNFDAVVIGVRAFNTREDLAASGSGLKALFDYVEAGGTVVEQYNRPDGLRNNTLAPYNIHLSALRVTDETAKMTFLAPDNPVLNTPNKITEADFNNWVQERSIYLPDQWDPKFTPILGAADPGESPPNSALLIADHGKGHFIYTSLVFFRQLPAANPGAYRLFANLLSLGKP